MRAENLEGGILAWSFVQGDLLAKTAAGETVASKRIHVFAKLYKLIHPDYAAVW